jgi:hypothetical protein
VRSAAPAQKPSAGPRLQIDAAVASAIVLTLAVVARYGLNPDGVAYLEVAEALARGATGPLVQGYWSPGLPILLAPLFVVIDDRAQLLAWTHIVIGVLSCAALLLCVPLVRKRVGPALQRAAWWICAWVIVRWDSPTLVTPDVLLLVLVAGVLLLQSREVVWSDILAGLIAGLAFLVKTSVWPVLLVAGGALCARAVSCHNWRLVPWRVVCPASVMIVSWIVVLSVHEGRPTLGSVGRLNAAWYLGDLAQRTPDTDTTDSHGRRVYAPAGGVAPVAYFEYGARTRTYLPWSDPERWARLSRNGAPPTFTTSQALETWDANVWLVAQRVVPLAVAIFALVGADSTRSWRRRWKFGLIDRPLLFVGVAGVATFTVVHAEARLIAPWALLCVIGAVGGQAPPIVGSRLRMARILVIGLAAADIVWQASIDFRAKALVVDREQRIAQFLKQYAGSEGGDVVVTGPALPLMGTLWRNRLRVGAQMDRRSSEVLMSFPDSVRWELLRRRFEPEGALGAVEVMDRSAAGEDDPLWTLHVW